jgi:Tol biopolymer transport system component
VPALPSGTYFFQIRYQESRRKPVQVVFSQEVIISNDKIAFESNRDGNLEIYVMNPDGSNPTRLTNNPSEDYNPVFSPDGSKIAFQRRYYFEPDQDGISPDPYVEIHIMNADGTDERRLTNTPVSDVDNGDQVFSPDGSKIAFTSSRDNGSHEIYLMNADGTNQINLTSSPSYDSNPVFSPDGSKIAFQSDRGGSYGIWLMNADGSAPALLVNNVSSASRPVFSPDGTRIAFTSYVNDSYDIFTVDVASGNVTRLTDHAASDTSPVFSPDGSTLIFQSDRSGSAAIYSIDLDDPTHTITKLADGEDAAFSPDGAKIVFQSYSSGNYDIYVMNANGSNAVCLTKNPASDINPVWG